MCVRCDCFGYQRYLMWIKCDCWTISVFDFVILFCSFYIYFVCLFLNGYRYWHAKCPYYNLPCIAGEMSGFRGFCGRVGVV